jgi:hypothetical protein
MWENLSDAKEELEILRKFLQNKLDIDWINNIDELYIRKTDERNALKISHRKNYVLIQPGEKIIVDGKPIEGYNVYLKGGALYIDTPVMSYEEFASIFLENGVKKNVWNLVFALTVSQIPESDFEILWRDTKFMELLEDTKRKFEGSYDKLIRLANEGSL